ncbi:alpha/beta hydrolase [Mycobacterium sp. IDR2000157661]|nr:alpha/beta hydrolase [Mycobacterium sp. IDR2000157661]
MFWPSLLMTGDMWPVQVRRFGADQRVILVDPPGHGGSEKLRAAFTFDHCAQCIADIIDALGIDRTHFVGNSWGGMIGGTFAALHPERIGRAVLMNRTASRAGLRQRVEFGLLLRIATVMGGVRPPMTRAVLKAFLGPTTFRTRPEVVQFVRASVQSTDVRSARWAVRSAGSVVS